MCPTQSARALFVPGLACYAVECLLRFWRAHWQKHASCMHCLKSGAFHPAGEEDDGGKAFSQGRSLAE